MFKTIHNLHYEQIGKEVRCIEDELPFEIPDSWEWARLNSVGSMARGNGIKRNEVVENGYPCIRYGEIYTSYNLFFKDSISHVGNNIYDSSKKIKRNDLVYTLTGENKPDIAKTVAYLGEKDIAAGGDLAVWSNHQMNPLYLSYLLSSPYMISNKVKLATGDIIVHISVDKVGSFIAPIPPLEEQNRIVKQILILEELIKEYSEKEEELYKLNSNIKEQLKKSILQYAIEGKLVPQNPNDEPASILLERIHKEKNKLIAEGKIKKDKNESIIYRRDNSYYEKQSKNDVCIDEQIPFSIPDSWCWIRFKEFTSFNIGKTPERDNDQFWFEGEYPWVSVADLVENGLVNSTKEKISKLALDKKFSNKLVKQGTLLMSFKLTVGKTSILDIDAVHNEAIISITPYLDYNNITRNYLFYSMPLLSLNGETKRAIKGNTLNSKSLNALLIPVPPIQEQRRIVDMIVKLNNLIG